MKLMNEIEVRFSLFIHFDLMNMKSCVEFYHRYGELIHSLPLLAISLSSFSFMSCYLFDLLIVYSILAVVLSIDAEIYSKQHLILIYYKFYIDRL